MTVEESFQMNFKRLIREKGYRSVKNFAVTNDLDYGKMWRYAGGKGVPTLVSLWQIAKVLECSMDEFTKGATE